MEMDSCCLISKQVHNIDHNGIAKICLNSWEWELAIDPY
jgi:hypothetical protein